MDERLQSRGVSLVSKCCCCVTSERETLNHLFIQSDLAKEVWGHLMSYTHVVFTGSTIQNLIYTWLASSSRRSQVGITIIGFIFYGFREIWKERCRIRFEDGTRNSRQLIHKICAQLYVMNLTVVPKRAATTWERTILDFMRMPVRSVAKK